MIPVSDGLIFYDRFNKSSAHDFFGRKYDVNTLSEEFGTFNGIDCIYTTNTDPYNKKYILIKDSTNFPTRKSILVIFNLD